MSKLTLKQEKFVAAYLETGNATEAYRRAYDCANMQPATINRNAAAQLENSKIATRLAELQAQAALTAVLTRAWVLERLMRNADAAHTLDDFTASNKALELLGKTDELAMFTERVASDNRHHHTAEPVSPFAEFITGAIGARPEDALKKPLPH